jgi:hypothetical protein
LWKSLHVEAGWEDAVEAVLRERISALTAEIADPAWSKDRPGSKLTLLLPVEGAVGGCLARSVCWRDSLRRSEACGHSCRLAG